MAAVAYDDRDEYWGRCTSSILRIPAFPEADFQCPLEDYFSTVGSIALGNDSTARLASDKLAAYCLVLYELDDVVVSYSAIRHVLEASRRRFEHWKSEDYTFDNLMSWLRVAHGVLLCILRSSSPCDLRAVYGAARTALLGFEKLLLEQRWICIAPEDAEQGRQDLWPGILPHRISSLLTAWILEPCVRIHESGNPAMLQAIPISLFPALAHTWAAVQLAYPAPLDIRTFEETTHMFSGIDRIGVTLADLKALSKRHDSGEGSVLVTT
ncbi:hypothetical protein C8Q76DRAFT_418881 [Earliella scabrosa]|nr:hypothetical protein C8Q76DRAFT_418881 [Earliella scabrosa]